MRKLFIGALALFVTQTAYAQDNNNGFDGAYVAADLGIADTTAYGSPITYGASLGYRSHYNDNLVLGAEVSYGRFSADRFSETFGEDVSIDTNLYSIAATAGYAFGADDQSLFSIGLGYTGASENDDIFGGTDSGILALAQFEWLGQGGLGVRLRASTIEFSDTWTYTAGLVFRF